uniref:Protein kinase domain-containing protein n=1 Tax=Globisporangium ultimum (strain ATCC 200006 / CBS 805.95 / DAOM BR144) TaxID=431595 RepID=K3X2R9_GLOUD
MRELCEAPYEFDQVLCGVAQRLEAICSLLETGLMDRSPDVITTFTMIVFRFCRLLFQLEKSASVLSMFIISTTYLHNVREFHEELDHFAELQNLVQHVGNWNDQWTQAETSVYQRMYEQLQTDKDLLHGLETYKDKYKVLIRLDHEIRKLRRGTNNPTVVRNFEQVAARLAVVCKIEAPRAPVWFIPFEAVERDKETGTGKWAKIQVAICSVYESKEYFFQEKASRWYQLSHPNVQTLFGACHISRPQFFVCEYGVSVLDALESQNDDRQLMWKYLLDAALGVQYLHQREIVHGDLRCENIVIGSDQKAKIRALFDKVDHTCGRHLKYEYLNRRGLWRPTSMLLGSATPKQDRSIIRPIRLHYIRPRSFSDAEWDLVTKMCASEPAERVRIVYVVHQLKQIATNDFLSSSAGQGSSKLHV